MIKNFNRTKWILFFFIVLALVFVLFYMVNFRLQEKNAQTITSIYLKDIQAEFNHLKELDTKMLSSNLEILVRDQIINEIYLEKDREKLYNYVQPLFQELKNKYGITHWYFILPDGHTFLRVHNKDIYDDEITRFTYYNARDTKEISSGLELGKTAYALRVVMPYYNGEELIGYIELGEEIDHFLEILNKEMGNEFVLMADKKFLNEEKWASVRNVEGLENNWNDLEEYLIISPLITEDQELVLKCFTEENIIEGKKGKSIFQEIKDENNIFRCAGIPLIDAGDRQSGMILSLIKMNRYENIAKNSNLIIAGFLSLIFILIVLMSYFLFKNKKNSKKLFLVITLIGLLSIISINSVSALSVGVHVPEKYTDVIAGERFYFEIDIKYPENALRKDLRLNYEILTSEGGIIAHSKVLKAIETQASFIDFIVVPESAESGLHILKVGISDYEMLDEEVEASFHITSESGEQIKLYFFILLGFVILLGVLVTINIISNIKK